MLTIRNCFILLLIVGCSYGVAIDTLECEGTFQCPDRCEVSYKPNGCPHNCNCGPAKKCPLVTCPAKAPTCAVYTQLDGCQTCACRIPYLLVESESEKEILNAGIIFVNRKDMVEVRRKLRDATRRRSFRDREVPKTQACTIDFMEKVDGCLTNASYLHEELKKKQTEGVVITLNPIIKTDKTDLQKMCAMYRHALRCIGPVAYTECRKSHPILAEIDAIYGYVCGTKQRIFETHLDCIQKLHIESYRLAVCEDSTHRAMRFIDASASDVVEKQKQKCEALNWMMRCEKSTILKRCSLEASIVNDESLISASQYISPECNADFKRNLFVNDEESKLIRREPIKCTAEQQQQVNDNFKQLELDVRSHEKETSIAYQVAYGYKKHELRRLCADYNNALKNTKSVVKRNCIRRFATYNIVYFQLNYPCGHGTSENFFRHFNCLSKVRQDEKIVKCEKNAARALDDPSNEPCDAYSILSECMYDIVVKKCGYDAWEIDYQYLSHLVGNTVPNCRMKRIVRNDHSKPA